MNKASSAKGNAPVQQNISETTVVCGDPKNMCQRVLHLLGRGVCRMNLQDLISRYGHTPRPIDVVTSFNSASFLTAAISQTYKRLIFVGELHAHPEIPDAVELSAIRDSSLPKAVITHPCVWHAMKALMIEARRASILVAYFEPTNTNATDLLSKMGFVKTDNENEWMTLVGVERALSNLHLKMLIEYC